MPAVAYRVRVRNVADTADLVTVGMPDLAAPLAGDGAELDPITGEVRSGSYSVRVVDAGGPARTVTQWLADATQRWQILSRRAICEQSVDGGAWTVLLAGYVTRVAFVSAIEAELEIGDRLRVPATAQAFGGAPGFTVTRGCLIGGPVTAAWGPVPARGGWQLIVERVDTTARELRLRVAQAWGPPRHDPTAGAAAVDSINEIARPLLAGLSSPIPYAAFGGRVGFMRAYLATPLTARLATLSGATTWDATPLVFDDGEAVGAPALIVSNTVHLRVAGTSSLPAVGDRLTLLVTTLAPTEQCPVYIDETPFAFALQQLQAAGVPVDSAAFAAADAAVGPLRLALRLLQPITVSELVSRAVLEPLGWFLASDTQGRLAPQRALLGLADLTSVATITESSLAGPPSELWTLDESTAVARYVWEGPVYRYGAATDTVDGIAVQTLRQEWQVGDLATYATRTVTITSLGMLRPAQAWDAATELISARARTVLAQRYARGAARTTVTLDRSATGVGSITLGSVVTNAIAATPNGDRRHGEASRPARLCQVLRLTEGVATREVLLEDIGPAAAAITTLPTLSLAADAMNPTTIANASVTNAATLNAAGRGVELQYALVSGTPAAADWIATVTYPAGQIPTGVALPVRLDRLGQTVQVRARTVGLDLLASAWTSPVSVTLTALPGVTALAAAPVTGNGSQLDVTWTRTATDGAVLEVTARPTADPTATLLLAQVLPAGSTRVTLRGLTAGTAYTVAVRALLPNTGAASTTSTTAATTNGTAPTVAVPAAVTSSSTGSGTVGVRGTLNGTVRQTGADVEVATSTDGGATWSAYATAATNVAPDPITLIANYSISSLGNTGTLFRFRMRATIGAATSGWVVADEDVNPFIRKITGV